ncbi:tetratricopeptide repeat protein, partial [Candidatus Omnitrophota bacterium]
MLRKIGVKVSVGLFVMLFLVFVPGTAMGASVKGIVKKADKLYKEGRYVEALQDYDQAFEKEPKDPVIQYNRAAALYRNNDFERSKRAFLESIATEKEDIALEQKSVYNAGNSEFRIGERIEKKDPQIASKNYKEALEYFKRAMELSPEDKDAKFNYE